jgi:hypothetical protein
MQTLAPSAVVAKFSCMHSGGFKIFVGISMPFYSVCWCLDKELELNNSQWLYARGGESSGGHGDAAIAKNTAFEHHVFKCFTESGFERFDRCI